MILVTDRDNVEVIAGGSCELFVEDVNRITVDILQ